MPNTEIPSALENIILKYLETSDKKNLLAWAKKFNPNQVLYWPAGGIESAIFKARYPDINQVLKMAELACDGKIQFSTDWHMERTWQPEKIGRRIDWDNSPNGDREWAHALARFSHLVELAIGYRVKGEEKYLETYNDHIRQFMEARLDGQSELWQNRLDAALRIFHLIKSYDIIKNAPQMIPEFRAFVFGIILHEVEFLAEGLGSKVGNWEFFIATSILTASLYLRSMFDLSAQQDKAARRLEEIIESEILPDGNLIEQAPMYHGEVILTLLDYLAALKSAGQAYPEKILEALRTMLKNIVILSDPQGKIFQIGDSDAYNSGYLTNYAEAVLEEKIEYRRDSFVNFQSAGWGVADWGSDEGKRFRLLFDASGKPPARRNWHSHADDLQFILHASDGPLFVDPGRFTYAEKFVAKNNPAAKLFNPSGPLGFIYGLMRPRFRKLNDRNWRNYFRRTLSHNTISCDGADQPGYDNIGDSPAKVELKRVVNKGRLIWMRGEADYGPEAYKHKRIVVCLAPNFMAVYDEIVSNQSHNWIASYHLANGIQVSRSDRGIVLLSGEENSYLMQIHSVGCSASITIDDDWTSPFYNQKLPSKTIRATAKKSNRWRLVATLIAGSSSKPENVDTVNIENVNAGDSERLIMTINNGLEKISFYLNSEEIAS
jgi:hypothetical protein